VRCDECEYFLKSSTHTLMWGDVDICMLRKMTGDEPDAECIHHEGIFLYTHGHNEKCTKGTPKVGFSTVTEVRVEKQSPGGKIPGLNGERDRVLKELFCKKLPAATITNAKALDMTPEEYEIARQKNAASLRKLGQIDPAIASKHMDT